jgi:DNA-binding NarL/FixJ family response regulator
MTFPACDRAGHGIRGRRAGGIEKKWRILIVDDNELVREGIAAVISRQPNFVVCGFASDEKAAAELIERKRPDVVVLELFLRHRDGVYLIKSLKQRFSSVRFVIHAFGSEKIYRTRVLRAGASAYIQTNASAAELVEVVTEVALPPAKTRVRRLVGSNRSLLSKVPVDALTDRELHVFRLIGSGLGTGRISAELGLSRKTIEYYCDQIKHKLGYNGAHALLQAALEWARSEQDRSPVHSRNGARLIRKKPGKSPVASPPGPR